VGADRAARRGERLRAFLAEKGEGVHHVAVATSNFDETVAQADRGNGVILSGEFGGARVAYLGTDRDLGVIIEVFSGTPDDHPDETSA
jgi:methylmalonyl-CoA/ethylmalonyl-CoA epimerase